MTGAYWRTSLHDVPTVSIQKQAQASWCFLWHCSEKFEHRHLGCPWVVEQRTKHQGFSEMLYIMPELLNHTSTAYSIHGAVWIRLTRNIGGHARAIEPHFNSIHGAVWIRLTRNIGGHARAIEPHFNSMHGAVWIRLTRNIGGHARAIEPHFNSIQHTWSRLD